MKKLILFLVIFISLNNIYAQQVYETKMSFGGGITYPRFFAVSEDGYSENNNYGAYVSFEKWFTEYVSLRSLTNYSRLVSVYSTGLNQETQKLNLFTSNLDILTKFIPCSSISPYLVFGGGFEAFTSNNPKNINLKDYSFGYQVNLGLGVDWNLLEDLDLRSEFLYITSSNNKIDGNDRFNENKGLFGGNGDTYAIFSLGLNWVFSTGDYSGVCEKCPGGVNEYYFEYNNNEQEPEIVYVTDTVYIPWFSPIYFEFDKDSLNSQARLTLEDIVIALESFSDIGVYVSGHADAIGTDAYNKELSKRRAYRIYNYLISEGVDKNRIDLAWFGEEKPVKSNDNKFNRQFNRRVEIRVP